MVPASVRFVLIALLLTTAIGCAAIGRRYGVACHPCSTCRSADACWGAPSGISTAHRQQQVVHHARCVRRFDDRLIAASNSSMARRSGTKLSDRRTWQPTGEVSTAERRRTPRSGIVQTNFELPRGIEASSLKQPDESGAGEPAETPSDVPLDAPAELFVPQETEAAPPPTEIVDGYPTAPSLVYGEVPHHAAGCSAQCEDKGLMDRLHDRFGRGEKFHALKAWLWDETYRFRIRNASQSRALHHDSFYEPVRPTYLPNYGHYQTLWRRFEEDVAFCPPEGQYLPAEGHILPGDGWEIPSATDAGARERHSNGVPVPPQPAPPVE